MVRMRSADSGAGRGTTCRRSRNQEIKKSQTREQDEGPPAGSSPPPPPVSIRVRVGVVGWYVHIILLGCRHMALQTCVMRLWVRVRVRVRDRVSLCDEIAG